MSDATHTADAIVVGGGIIGLACALAFAREGHRTLVIEKNRAVGMGTSRHGQGGVGIGLGLDDWGLEWHRLAMQSYADFAATGVDISYRRCGGLIVASNPVAADRCRVGAQRLTAIGLDAQWLDDLALRDAEPQLAHGMAGAVRVGEFAEVTPLQVVATLHDLCIAIGVRMELGTEVTGLERKDGAVCGVSTPKGSFAAPRIIVACGLWTREIARLAEVDVPIWPLKGHLLMTEPMPPATLNHYVSVAEYGKEPGADAIRDEAEATGPAASREAEVAAVLRSTPAGPILIGSSREFAGLDEAPNPDTVKRMMRSAIALMPSLADAAVEGTSVGFRPWTPDGRPLIGPVGDVPGLFLAAGHGGDGTTGALLTARILADQIAGRDPILPLAPVAADRFSRRAIA